MDHFLTHFFQFEQVDLQNRGILEQKNALFDSDFQKWKQGVEKRVPLRVGPKVDPFFDPFLRNGNSAKKRPKYIVQYLRFGIRLVGTCTNRQKVVKKWTPRANLGG